MYVSNDTHWLYYNIQLTHIDEGVVVSVIEPVGSIVVVAEVADIVGGDS